MPHPPSGRQSSASQGKRRTMGDRTMVACTRCKERKQKCDAQSPICGNCQRLGRTCLVEDPTTGRHQPRNYLQSLEERVALLEGMLQQVRPEVATDHFSMGDFPDPELEFQAMDSMGSQSIESEYGNGNGNGHAPVALDNEDDLSSVVGLLSLDSPSGEAHYFGSTSAFAFSRLINPELRRLRTQGMIKPICQNGDLLLSMPCPLPSPAIGKALSSAYFENIHPQYPFLHQPTFQDWEESLIRDLDNIDIASPNPLILFFVNIVYAIGAILVPSSGCSSKRFYASSQLYMEHVMQMESLESVQALLCCAMYSLRSVAGVSIWKLSGLALRQCTELGYHRNHKSSSNFSPLRNELKKRSFWCAYGIDRAAGISLGRPFGVSDDDIDVDYPIDIDDYLITDTGINGNPRMASTDPSTSMSAAIHTFRLRRLWSRFHTSLYSIKNIKNGTKSPVTTEQLRAELTEWRDTIPVGQTMTSGGSGLTVFRSQEWFDLAYNHSILLIHRGQLAKRHTPDQSQAVGLFAECADVAKEICHGYRKMYIGRATSYTWGSLHIVFLAGLTYLHCLWTSSIVREAIRDDEVMDTCMSCTMVLVVMAERWDAVAPYRDIFEALMRKTMSMIYDARLQKGAPKVAHESAPLGFTQANINESNMAQWCIDIANVGMNNEMETMLTGFVGEFR